MNSSAETLPNIPKTPDTSFENKPQGTKPGAGVIPAEARLELGGKKLPNQRGWEQEGGHKPSEFRQHKDLEKATQPPSEPHHEGREERQLASAEQGSDKRETVPSLVEPQPKA